MHIKPITTALLFGLTLFPAIQLLADEVMVIQKPSPGVTEQAKEADVTQQVKSPRDPASGQATGKRQHKPYNIQSTELEKRGLNPQPLPPKSTTGFAGDNDLSKQGLNPQPLPPSSSGLPSGKRQHKPVSVTKPVDKVGLNPQPLPPKEVDSMDNIKMQQHMDAQNKAASTMSNITKKQSDTSNAIIGNIK